MSVHETKSCPRCGQPFECKPANIAQCQCFGLLISTELQDFMEKRYTDCLCRGCLEHLQSELNLFKEKYFGG